MDRGFYNEDFNFEELIRYKSDQFKMHPSQNVWKRISRKVHPITPYLWIGLAVLLTGTGYFAATQWGSLREDEGLLSQNDPAQTAVLPSAKITALSAQASKVDYLPRNGSNENKFNTRISLTSGNPIQNRLSLTPSSLHHFSPERYVDFAMKGINLAETIVQPDLEGAGGKDLSYSGSFKFNKKDLLTARAGIVEPMWPLEIAGLNKKEDKGMQEHEKVNWLQEYAAYELSLPKTRRVNWLVTLSPTMNYRRMVGSKTAELPSDVKNGPLALSLKGNVDALVNHQPARGLELSSLFAYTLNRKWTFLSGVQFNYSRYDIRAFSAPTNEKATISVSRYSGLQELTSYTVLRNFGGTSEKNLENEYYQISLPVGMQYTLVEAGRWQMGVSGSVQPTYVLNKNNYLISSDYKNYTKEPSLINPWNINTSAEAFISYKYGNTRLQVGPQFRYQLFSSYAKEYPVKEYLMQYGFKIGVSRSVR